MKKSNDPLKELQENKKALIEKLESSDVMTLRECLEIYTKPDLNDLIDANGYDIKKSLKKDLIIEKLEEMMLCDFSELLQILSMEEYVLLMEAITNEQSVVEDEEKFALLEFKGYVHFFDTEDDEVHLVIPKDLAILFLENCVAVCEEECMKRQMVKMAVISLCHLYGVFPEEQLKLVWQCRQGEPLDKKIVEDVVRLLCLIPAEITAVEGLFAMDFLLMDKAYQWILKESEGKEYYMPTESEFLYFMDHDVDEDSVYYHRLKDYMRRSFHLEEDALSDLMWRLYVDSVSGLSKSANFMGIIEDEDITFENDQQIEKFLPIYMDFTNNSRKWLNKGHTPEEIYSGADKAKPMLRSIDGGITNVRQEKIGRNDPCPCGSGKKYKNCCGGYLH